MDDSRRWWPNYLFHCTELHNAVNILRVGALLSRTEAQAANLMAEDIAAPVIIERTPPKWQNHVRLYFRPRTPTQYQNEGIRPQSAMPYGAQCAIPIYFLFDAVAVLTRQDTLFTDGNLARGPEPSQDIEDFAHLPFPLIYHDTWFDANEQDRIVYHRNAEVLVPKKLDLSSLRWIVCRSSAEFETLLHLLPTHVSRFWANKIGVRPDYRLFHNRWTFVERVNSSQEALTFTFNTGTESAGPFDARVTLLETATGQQFGWRSTNYSLSEALRLRLGNLSHPRDYEVRFRLDDHLAYANRIQEDDLPF